jgi:chromosome segregation ATPase
MADPQEAHHFQSASSKADPLRFVDTLADEQDYWLSLTDAARITRTSEVMVRRWVASGRLPIRKEPVGINQRTRLVRASDVARLRPIIDPTAAITGELHKLDLLSIPRQQAQIMHDHQRLSELAQQMRQSLEEHIHQTRAALEESTMTFHQHIQTWNQRFSSHQAAWQQALALVQARHEALADQMQEQVHAIEQRSQERSEQRLQEIEQLRAVLRDQFQEALLIQQQTSQEFQRHLEHLDQNFRQQTGQLSSTFTADLHQQEERIQNIDTELKEMLQHYEQVQQRLQQAMTDLQHELAAHQNACVARLEQQTDKIYQDLEARRAEYVHERATQDHRLTELERRLESMTTQDQAVQQKWRVFEERMQAQEQQIEKLTTTLQEERAVRRSLADQLAALRRKLESLKARKAEMED